MITNLIGGILNVEGECKIFFNYALINLPFGLKQPLNSLEFQKYHLVKNLKIRHGNVLITYSKYDMPLYFSLF